MRKFLVLFLAAALLLTGCARGAAKPVLLTKDVPQSEAGKAPVAAVTDYSPATAFALRLFAQSVKSAKENPVLSPASAYLCLAMVQNGADTQTLAEFAEALGADTDELNALCRALIAGLTKTAGSTKLSIANSAWADDDLAQIEKSYLQAIVDNYGADVFGADLPSDEALAAINGWVNEKTNGLIPKLHDENYPADTVLVLLNSLYFKAKWAEPFLGGSTFDGTFTKAGGTAVTVPFMHAAEGERDYIHIDGAEGVLLPYDDGKTAFVALRPTDGGDIRAFAENLTAEQLARGIASAKRTAVNLSMPKFTVEYEQSLNDVLMDMGIKSVFDPGSADLTKMGAGAGAPLYISSVFQKVKLIVDEEGTEAAAVTEAVATRSAFIESVELHFDRPFLYAVVDLTTGVPLFVGVLENPAQ